MKAGIKAVPIWYCYFNWSWSWGRRIEHHVDYSMNKLVVPRGTATGVRAHTTQAAVQNPACFQWKMPSAWRSIGNHLRGVRFLKKRIESPTLVSAKLGLIECAMSKPVCRWQALGRSLWWHCNVYLNSGHLNSILCCKWSGCNGSES